MSEGNVRSTTNRLYCQKSQVIGDDSAIGFNQHSMTIVQGIVYGGRIIENDDAPLLLKRIVVVVGHFFTEKL